MYPIESALNAVLGPVEKFTTEYYIEYLDDEKLKLEFGRAMSQMALKIQQNENLKNRQMIYNQNHY